MIKDCIIEQKPNFAGICIQTRVSIEKVKKIELTMAWVIRNKQRASKCKEIMVLGMDPICNKNPNPPNPQRYYFFTATIKKIENCSDIIRENKVTPMMFKHEEHHPVEPSAPINHALHTRIINNETNKRSVIFFENSSQIRRLENCCEEKYMRDPVFYIRS